VEADYYMVGGKKSKSRLLKETKLPLADDRKALVPIRLSSGLSRRSKELRTQGHSMPKIAAHLNRERVVTRGRGGLPTSVVF
jgi:hypothetical protein